MKKAISLLLAFCLVVSFCCSAYAASPIGYNPTTDTYSSWFAQVQDWVDAAVAATGAWATGADYDQLYTAARYLTVDGAADGNGRYHYGNSGAQSAGTTYSYLYNGGDNYNIQNDYNTYRVLNSTNNSYYNPVTNNYMNIDNSTTIKYSPTYNTYNITNNEYNTYVTNNYTYISYYIYDPVEEISWYYEIYYLLPDGRNSYDLEAEDVWGQYFFYDAVNYQEVAEDDGVTLGLYHFDGNLFDSSAKSAAPCTSDSTMFSDGHFSSAHYLKYGTVLYVPIPSNCYTVEFYFYLTSSLHSGSSRSSVYQYFSDFGISSNVLALYTDQWNHIAITKVNDTTINLWLNGSLKLSNFSGKFADTLSIYPDSSSYCYVDELRLSNKVLYTDTFTPSAQPFDTNLVLVVPETGSETSIAVKSNIPVNGLRVGGVRPTYPVNGYVYVYLEDDKVVDVQQYQQDGWYSVTASIYENGAWTPFNGKDVSTYVQHEPDPVDPTPTPDPGGQTTPETGGGASSGDDDDGGLWDTIKDLFGDLIDLLASLIGGAVKLLAGVLGGIVDLFKSLLSFCTGFTDFLTAAFGFLPAEMLAALSAGIIIMVVLAIVKFIGGFL